MQTPILLEQTMSVSTLIIKLFQGIAIIGVGAYIFTQSGIFRNLFIRKLSLKEKILMIFLFALIAIAGTYLGIPIKGALANTRAVGAIAGGLFGGPLVGLGAGLIAGAHRFFIGGYTGFACGLATTTEGLLAGLILKLNKGKEITLLHGFFAGIIGESLQMVLLILFARPVNDVVALIKIISFPMMIVNSFGIMLFIHLVNKAKADIDKVEALQAHKALKIANQTLSHLRHGLNQKSAKVTANIIFSMTEADAVSLTDKKIILAHVGIGSDHHFPGEKIITELTNKVMNSGELIIANTAREIKCSHENCPFGSAIVVPLKIKNEVMGTLKFYYARPNSITPVRIELGKGLAQLLSTQLELSQLETQSKLRTTAELKALQAQINPHFLFNALNTIIYFSRIDSEISRKLLIHLSEFFRKTLKNVNDFIPLSEEIDLIKAYLTIEKARFGDRLEVVYDISEDLLDTKIPTFILQPLVENAVKHGIAPKLEGGIIKISVKREYEKLNFCVNDTGVGIPIHEKERLLQEGVGKGMGIGLSNINNRLRAIYGGEYNLKFSCENENTKVFFSIPFLNEVKIFDS